MRCRRRYWVPRRPRIPPSASIAPVAQHRGGNAQLACDPAQRPTAAHQQGYRFPLELIRKMTPSLAHSTPFRSRRSLAKVSTNSREPQSRTRRSRMTSCRTRAGKSPAFFRKKNTRGPRTRRQTLWQCPPPSGRGATVRDAAAVRARTGVPAPLAPWSAQTPHRIRVLCLSISNGRAEVRKSVTGQGHQLTGMTVLVRLHTVQGGGQVRGVEGALAANPPYP